MVIKIAEALMEKETLTSEEIEEVLGKKKEESKKKTAKKAAAGMNEAKE